MEIPNLQDQLEENILVSTNPTKEMGTVSCNMLTGTAMRELGQTISSMAKESIPGETAVNTRAAVLMESEKDTEF